MKVLYIHFFLCISSVILAQDSTKVVSSEFGIELYGTQIVTSFVDNIACINCNNSIVFDNPMNHFAIYTALKHDLNLNNKYKLTSSLYLEERSFSGGNNTLKNIVVFPQIRFSGVDTFSLFNTDFTYKIDGGDFWNEDISDIIRIYNIDYHASSFALGLKDNWIGLLTIGDLASNIGLGLHQYYKLFYTLKNDRYTNTLSLAINELNQSLGHTVSTDYNFANHSKVYLSDSTMLVGQFETRYNKVFGFSIAAALEMSYKAKCFSISSRLKYFDAEFNLGYKNFRPNYASPGSFIGDQLYPLKNFYRPFSQWAVYTDFQNNSLIGFENELNYRRRLFKNVFFDSTIDLTMIYNLDKKNIHVVPLYQIGIRLDFLKELQSFFLITNKHMDLENFFQTFKASQLPFFSYTVHLDIDRI